MTDHHQGYAQRLAELNATIERARLSPEVMCERAAGLLAGRSGCRIDDAHAHIRLLAAQRGSDAGTVAASVIAALETGLPMTSAGLTVPAPVPADPEGAGAHQDDRIMQTERLGLLGWGEWDLITDATVWSAGLYRIYERDPALGPLPREESDALGLPEDEAQRRHAAEAFGRGQTVDVTTRARINGKVKWLRAVVDAVRDTDGRPIKIYGIIQDVTARETSRRKLAEVEEQLREHQRSLATEHRVATQLQQIVIPIPEAPIDLPGLRVGVRYLLAEQAGRVGGDWYHAAEGGDGSIILAIGDVAGHGLHAATTMATLRHALAALAGTTTCEPATLLTHLNHLIFKAGPGGTTATGTAVVARYQPADHTLTWAQAGHPAPLLTRRGTATELGRPAGPLLGATRQAAYATARVTLDPGDLLVLYTDGLVEHRSHTLRQGIDRVTALLDRILAAGDPEPMQSFLTRLRRANPDDDTCVLVAHRSGSHA